MSRSDNKNKMRHIYNTSTENDVFKENKTYMYLWGGGREVGNQQLGFGALQALPAH